MHGHDFTATLNGISRMATLTVNPVIPATLMLTPSILSGGNSGTGTVTLNYASNTDKSVSLSSSDTVTASVPATVTVPAGQTTAQFPVTTFSVLILKNVNITATLNSISIQSAVFVTPIKLVSVTTSPTSVIGGKSSTGKVTLSAVAPVGGYVVNLSSSNPSAASVPASVTVIAGVKTATFAITTTPVVSLTKPVITGSFGGGSKSATLSITPPALSSIKLSASSVIGGVTATGTATLTGKAPTGGIVVALNSDTPSIATTPASVTILAGSLSAAFPITTVPVPVNSTVGIHGVYNAVDKSVTLTVKAPVVSALSLKPTTVHGGSQNSVGTVTLTGNASVGGFTVNLSSSNTSAATVPANVTILAGQKKATFTVTTLTVGIQTKPIITATTGIVSKSATLTVNP